MRMYVYNLKEKTGIPLLLGFSFADHASHTDQLVIERSK